MKPSTVACLDALRSGAWVSGNVLFRACGTRYGGRIFELRHDYGYVIERRSVRGTEVDEYRLVPASEQLTLGVAS